MNNHDLQFEALAAAWGQRLARLDLALKQYLNPLVNNGAQSPEPIPSESDTTANAPPLQGWRVPGDPIALLADAHELDEIDEAILTITLAPQIDPRYGLIYTKMDAHRSGETPTAEILLSLLGPSLEQSLRLRRRLGADGRLVREGWLIRRTRTTGELAATFQPNPVLVSLVTGGRAADPGLAPRLRAFGNQQASSSVTFLPCEPLLQALGACSGQSSLIALTSAPGCRLDPAGIAQNCARAGYRLLTLNPAFPLPQETGQEVFARRTGFLARLLRAAVLVTDRPAEKQAAAGDFGFLASLLSEAAVPLIGPPAIIETIAAQVSELPVLHVQLEMPDSTTRRHLWYRALRAEKGKAAPDDLDHIAARFRLGVAEIRRAARDATAAAPNMAKHRRVSRAGLIRAAKAGIQGDLERLAQRLTPGLRLEQIVLPATTHQRILEVIEAIRHRERVFTTWGFDAQSHAATGLGILFAGASGVGKTATATAIAAEVGGQDLFRIDLSALVSKYIGETEKNLDRVFNAAAGTDAILFFDEADALFGKRSEVKDSHDRYANLETAYLLQKMEAHDGVSILASNISRNMDTAFLRRLQFVVDFPRPEAGERARLWRRMLPDAAPKGSDIDFDMLAHKFELTGGEIRTITLDAAFLAITAGSPIGMRELIRATARNQIKRGRAIQPRDFRPFETLLDFGPSPDGRA
jgi:hypothetical protein